MDNFKGWVNDRKVEKEVKEPKPDPEPESEPEKKETFKAAKIIFSIGIFLLIFLLIGIIETPFFDNLQLFIDDIGESPYSDYRPFRWRNGTTWHGEWFGCMQTNSWTWLNYWYKKFFNILASLFTVVKYDEKENGIGKIMKGFGKFFVLMAMGFVSFLGWLIFQVCFGVFLPITSAIYSLIISSPDKKDMEDRGLFYRVIGWISLFFTYVPTIFFTWILQIFYFPFLVIKHRKKNGGFYDEAFDWIRLPENKGGFFTIFSGLFYFLLPGLFFLLLGDTISLVIGATFLIMLLFFSIFSIMKFKDVLEKEISGEIPIVKGEEVELKDGEKSNLSEESVSLAEMKGGRKKRNNRTRKTKKYI